MLTEKVKQLTDHIKSTAIQYARNPENILMLAVSKTQNAECIRLAWQAGVRHFGENYLQEALSKQKVLEDLAIVWHFIGPVQSNKVPAISAHFDWIHSLSRDKIAHLLNAHRPENLPPLQVCIQVNLDLEDSKSGVSPEECTELAHTVQALPRLKLRGLMAIPEPKTSFDEQYASLQRLTQLQAHLNQTGDFKLDTLSMGMSEDMDAAIKAGSTILRIGRALFGERK